MTIVNASGDDTDDFCKCRKCRYASTEKCKVVDGTFSKIAYCRGPYKKEEID